jgi:hypothetical protein
MDQHFKSPPVQASLLTAQAELPPLEPDDPSPEGAERTHITRHGVVVEVALHDRPQPLPCPCDGLVSTWGPCSGTDRPLVPLPVSRLISLVSRNSIASMTPILPDPFGPEIANVFL